MSRILPFLLAGLPVAVASRLLHGPEALTLAAAAVAIVPLAGWVARATQHAASHLGAATGGLLNATFGNIAELIITVFALRRGLTDLVKASLTGSIIGNTLLVLGLSAIAGGARHGPQKFAVKPAGRHAAMMILAVCAMALPAVFATAEKSPFIREEVSIGISLLLLATYAASLLYSRYSARGTEDSVPVEEEGGKAWSLKKALGVLAVVVCGIALASELLVEAVEPVSRSLGLTHAFLGVILLPLIGNVAENSAAIRFARRGHMDLSLSIAANSSTQIAVFVAPLLVLISLFFHPMDLTFPPIQLVTLFASSAIFAYICLDGETNWLEGVQLLALYLIAAVAFFFLRGS